MMLCTDFLKYLDAKVTVNMPTNSRQASIANTSGSSKEHPIENPAIQTLSQAGSWKFREVVKATLVLVLVVFGFWLLYRFYQLVFLFFIAIVMGTVIRPMVTWLHRRGLSQKVGIIIVYLFLFALFIGFALLLLPLIIQQGTTILSFVPGYYQSLRVWMVDSPNLLIVSLSGFLPVTLPGLAPVQQTGQQVLASAGQAIGYVTSTARIIFIVIVFLALAYYWTLSGPRTIQSLLLLVPKEKREGISELISTMESKVGSYIAGQGVLCLVIALMALVGYLFIGLPNVLVLALVVGVMEAVPMVGPLLGALPAALVALSISPDKLFWVIVITVIIHQSENYLLAPRIMRKAVGVNPFVSLLALLAFGSLFGLGGVLMAIPLTAIIQLLLDRFVFKTEPMESEVSPGRDYTSRLRYETQELAQGMRKQARFKKFGSDRKIKQVDHVMDEIEAITTDLDALLAQVHTPGAQ
jgi:predicted PurR-regulated permease PerM